MATGHVKWFNRRKGFGFITQGGGEDIFVHYSQIEGDPFREDQSQSTASETSQAQSEQAQQDTSQLDSLEQGDAVEFELCEGPRGLHAINVRLKEKRGRREESR